jgi:membrane-associated protease RseP (regulator of RpoE activity)
VEILGIIAFALLIAASIALHELGHLIPAKLFGVRVTEYMIGFGPTLWSRVRGETRYGIKAIPLGGYIRMIGMLPPAKPGEAPRTMSTGRFAQLIDDARKQSMSEVGPEDANRVFYKLSVPKRLIIMAGGPVMNLVLAFVLFTIVLVGIGLPEPTIRVGAVVPCVPTASQPTGQPLPSGQCPTGTEATPASLAGLQPQDTVLAIDGRQVQAWNQITDLVTGRSGETITVTIDRAGVQQEIPVTVAQIERPVVDEAGQPTGEVVPSGFLGVRPAFEYVPQPWSSVPETMWDLTVASVVALISLPVRLYELVVDTLIGGGERAVDGPVSVVGVSRLGGEIAAMDEPVNAKIATFLSLAASLNLFLFLFNLLPVLPLDGGHIAGALVEGARRQLARLRGRPDPGPVDVARLLPVAYVVASVLIAMGVIVIWADIVKPISLG